MSYSRFERSSHFFIHTHTHTQILLHFFIELLSLQHLGASFDDGGDGDEPQWWEIRQTFSSFCMPSELSKTSYKLEKRLQMA